MLKINHLKKSGFCDFSREQSIYRGPVCGTQSNLVELTYSSRSMTKYIHLVNTW